jgi:alcohol dehydrogenase class IV
MRFEFATAAQVVFGAGTLAQAGKLARPWGRRALLVTGRNPRRADRLQGYLAEAGIEARAFTVDGEPTVADVGSAVSAAREAGAEMVIGFGGGSAIDAAKATAGLLANPGDPLDYLEVVGRGRPLLHPAMPWMAIPTTAGTGAEVTRNAVLGVPERSVKVSLRSSHLLARIALVDPELTLELPPSVTASSGMDALTQLLEAYVCLRANPMTDALAAAGVPRITRAFPAVRHNSKDLAARTDLALASLWSGLALANAGLGAVHGFAAAIGGMFRAPHGAVCAVLLAPVMSANLAALRARAGASPALGRYGEIGGWLTGRSGAGADEGVEWVRAWVAQIGLPGLAAYGVSATKVDEVVVRAQASNSMRANPIALASDELAGALAAAM